MEANSDWISLAIGGAIGIAGTLLSQALGLFSGHIERRHQRDVKQRERLERIVDLITHTLDWPHELGLSKDFETAKRMLPPMEARTIAMLSRLYFPNMASCAESYYNALLEHYSFMIGKFDRDFPGSVAASIIFHEESTPEFHQSVNKIARLRQGLDDAVANEAKGLKHT